MWTQNLHKKLDFLLEIEILITAQTHHNNYNFDKPGHVLTFAGKKQTACIGVLLHLIAHFYCSIGMSLYDLRTRQATGSAGGDQRVLAVLLDQPVCRVHR